MDFGVRFRLGYGKVYLVIEIRVYIFLEWGVRFLIRVKVEDIEMN